MSGTGPEERATDPAGEPVHPARPRPRRWVIALALVTVFVLGVAGGVVADRTLARDCASCPAPAGEATPLAGTVEGSAAGVLSVRTPAGALVAVRTSPATRVVAEERRDGPAAAVPRGTQVTVLGVRDADGTLTATAVSLPPPGR